MRSVLAALLLTLAAGPALAHSVDPAAPPGWTLDLWITGPLALAAGLFGLGFARLAGRSRTGAASLRRRGLLFAAGWSVLTLAVVSPLHQLGERSFTAHMLEHELMMLLAAPLMVLAEPLAVMLWAFPAPARRAIGGWSRSGAVQRPWRTLVDPVVATLAQAAALWLWHAPALFDRALAHEGWHVAQHLSFLVTALLFWSAMLHGRQRSRNYGPAALCLFATSVVSGALGAFMAFSESPWYPRYEAMGLAPLGLSPTEDQQLAGLLMWVPGGLVHAVAALALVGLALRDHGPEAAHAP
jgi:cytochrome c oxidase assembly factor CtaG